MLIKLLDQAYSAATPCGTTRRATPFWQRRLALKLQSLKSIESKIFISHKDQPSSVKFIRQFLTSD